MRCSTWAIEPIRRTTAQRNTSRGPCFLQRAVFAPRPGFWTHCDRATWAVCVELLVAYFPKPTAKLWRCPWEVLGLQSKLPEDAILSQVWLPRPRVVLGERAGEWCRHLVKMNGPEGCWRKGAKTSPLVAFS